MTAADFPKITLRTWLILAALAVTGQIAWAVENSWFNTFVYDTITPDPRPVAWMVAGSLLRDAPLKETGAPQRSFWAEFVELFSLETVR